MKFTQKINQMNKKDSLSDVLTLDMVTEHRSDHLETLKIERVERDMRHSLVSSDVTMSPSHNIITVTTDHHTQVNFN